MPPSLHPSSQLSLFCKPLLLVITTYGLGTLNSLHSALCIFFTRATTSNQGYTKAAVEQGSRLRFITSTWDRIKIYPCCMLLPSPRTWAKNQGSGRVALSCHSVHGEAGRSANCISLHSFQHIRSYIYHGISHFTSTVRGNAPA